MWHPKGGILRRTTVPAPIPASLRTDAVLLAGRILNALDYVGVMGVELFIGELQTGWLTLINVTLIAILTFGLAVPLLRLDRDFFPRTPAEDPGSDADDGAELSPAES